MRSRHPGLLGAVVASLSLGAVAVPMAAVATPSPDDKPRRHDGLPAGINRHTGKPHDDAREIARRKRQAKRLHDTYMLNGGFTRRGNEAGPVNL